jgi:hypothetical protein
MLILVFLLDEPVNEHGKVIFHLFSIEYSVNHVTAKQTHFYLISRMAVNLFIFMDYFKDV